MADHEPPQTFPERIRVHALAKLLGVTSKQVLAELEAMGTPARSVQSSVVRTDAETLASTFSGSPVAEAIAAEVSTPEAPAPDAAPAAPEAPASTEPDLFTGIETEPVAAASHSAEAAAMPLFLQPEPVEAPKARRRSRSTAKKDEPQAAPADETETPVSTDESASDDTSATPTPDEAPDSTQSTSDESDADESDDASGPRRRRRGRRGRGRGRGDQNDGDTRDESSDATVTDSTPDSTASDADTTSDEPVSGDTTSGDTTSGDTTSEDGESGSDDTADETSGGSSRRSGNRRSRGRRSGGAKADAETSDDTDPSTTEAPDAESATDTSTDVSGEESSGDDGDGAESGDSASRRRRRRRRRKTGTDASGDAESTDDDPPNTVVHEREPRSKARPRDEVQGISGSTRLEAKRQRRRDGRDAGRRRPPILTESEFLARREAVDRTMVVREKALPGHPDLTQVAVLEDGVLVEHFVTSTASGSIAGNVYLGRVQNVLPSMEAAFIDIGKGRNGVLYAGEVDWDAAGLGGSSRKIEQALKPGDQVLVQVSKDPVGHKGARLTTQISLAGRFLVYVPGGSSTGISRKLPDNERKRLKDILRDIVPPEAGVIIRTASEGVSAEELARDVTRLQAQWATVSERSSGAESAKGSAPVTLYEEPDLLVKVVRDLFNEDFSKLVIEGDRAWSTVQGYIETVAPDMLSRVERYEGTSKDIDVFAAYRIDEQLAKALDRKVWLPSGGTLVIDRTEAMTVVDVNTGKFTGEGGNLEETVTRNNLEAAEEVVRQMRLRDIGGMIVVDFIDMVLESNRDLVLRRLTEALGRDRTRHQVSEVTSLGLVQMTRKRMGTGLIEAFSTNCEHCHGRGLIMHQFPVEPAKDDGGRGGNQRSDNRSDNQRSEGGSRRKRGGRDRGDDTRRQDAPEADAENTTTGEESATDLAARRAHPVALAMAAHLHPDEFVSDDAANAADSDTASAAAEAAAAVAAVRDADKAEPSTPEPAVSENTEPAAEPEAAPTRARRSRRVSRAASAPAGESAGTVIVVPVADSAPSTDDNATAASDSAPAETVATEAPAEPVTVGGEASVAPTAPARRPRRRAAGRPAGPPVDED